MISPRILLRGLVVLQLVCMTLSGVAFAQDEERETARRHLRLGVALFQEQNYAGALAEFQASYRDMQSAAALQNMALAQTKLFRYVQALETLESLKRSFGDTLSAQDRDAVEKTMQELSLLIGTLTIEVNTAGASVSINGKSVSIDKPIRLSSGEYRIAATAPDHSTAEQMVTVAGGENKKLTLTLQAQKGKISIETNDPGAAIAVDRRPVAYSSWTGTIEPGVHLLQVYKRGHVPYSTQVTVRAGDDMELRIPLGPRQDGDDSDEEDPDLPYDDAPAAAEQAMGWYGLVTATNLQVLTSPDGFTAAEDGDAAGGFFGLRGGYRFGRYIGLEAMVESGTQSVSGTDAAGAAASYDLLTRRFGGNVRLMLGGDTVRLSGTVNVGGAYHELEMAGVVYKGTNSYLGFELGPQFNVGPVLIGADLQVYVEGTTQAKAPDKSRAYRENSVISHGGIGLRVGYSQWGRW